MRKKDVGTGGRLFLVLDVGAFCFSGDETALSVSGRDYQTSERLIAWNDIITIDLSPQRDSIWGDYARTIVVEDGRVIYDTPTIQNTEWRQGLSMEGQLHKELLRFVTPDTTFEALYRYVNTYILQNGYCNLDFLGNLGHSIVKNKADRLYIEQGNTIKLSQAAMFTFEPHIGKPGSVYGFKQEDIYYFEHGVLKQL